MKEFYLKPQNETRASFYNKAIVKESENKAVLFSYLTNVCEVNTKEKTFKLNKSIKKELLLSNTTLRHLKAFLSFYEVKNAPKTKKDFERVLRG